MAKCPAKGCRNGKMTLGVVTITADRQREESESTIDCIWCDGRGDSLTDDEAKAIADDLQRFHQAWCRCEVPGDMEYYECDNGAHGYNCSKCGRILQTG